MRICQSSTCPAFAGQVEDWYSKIFGHTSTGSPKESLGQCDTGFYALKKGFTLRTSHSQDRMAVPLL